MRAAEKKPAKTTKKSKQTFPKMHRNRIPKPGKQHSGSGEIKGVAPHDTTHRIERSDLEEIHHENTCPPPQSLSRAKKAEARLPLFLCVPGAPEAGCNEP